MQLFIIKTMQNLPAIPKTASKARLLENLKSMELKLTPEDIAELDTLNKVNYRNNYLDYAKNHPEYPFNLPY